MHHRTTSPRLLLLGLVLLLSFAPPSQVPIVGAKPALAATTPAATALPSTPANAEPDLHVVDGLGAVIETSVISGSLAYVGEYNKLVILDVSNPVQPVVLADLDLSGRIKGLQILGDLLYVANYFFGLQIIDVSNPLHPELRGSLPIAGAPSDIQVVNGRAYIPAYNAGLKIIDVTNPISPTLLGGSTEAAGSVTGVKVVNDRAYIAGLGGLFIFDISDPLTPHMLGRFRSLDHGGGHGSNLDVVEPLVYLADGSGGLQIIDATNPASPTLRGSIDLPSYSLAVQVSGGLAYIASRENGLSIVDVSAPASPILRGRYATGGEAYDVQLLGELVYLSDYTGGLLILDVANPGAPAMRGAYLTVGITHNSWVQDGLAYVAAGEHGLRIVDLTTSPPGILSSLSLPGEVWSVKVEGKLAYLCEWLLGKLYIVDVDDPTNPRLLGTYSTPQRATDVELVGTLAYVTGGGGGLEVVDVSDPATPAYQSRIDTNGFARSLNIVGSLVYIANEAGGLQIVDITDPLSPTLQGKLTIPNLSFSSVHVVDDLAYVAYSVGPGGPISTPTTPNGLQIIDVSDPLSPTLRTIFDTGTATTDVQVVGDYAYVTASNKVLMLGVSDPDNPQLLDEITLAGESEGIYVQANRIYVTGYMLGLQILSSSAESTATITPSGGQLASIDGSLRLDFPTGAVSDTVTITYTSLISPTQLPPDDRTMARNFQLEARDSSGQPVAQFAKPFTMVISYTEEQLASLDISEHNLNLIYWDGETWADLLPCEGCGVDTEQNRVTVVLDRFGEFALVASPQRKVFLPLIGG